VLEFQVTSGCSMDDGGRAAKIVRFGIFEADLQTGELRKNGLKVPLQGQPFQVCAILLQHSGKLVTREELRQSVWPEDTFVDFDHALNTAIAKIRIALGDDADNPRFVETMPRRGYRFISPVEKQSSQAPLLRAPKGLLEKSKAKMWIAVGATGATLLLLLGISIWRLWRNRAESLLPSVEVVPLVVMPGDQHFPVFSPDGNQVAFAAHDSDGKNQGIYTTLIDGTKPLWLASGDSPTWSPDGRQIAFTRYSPGDKPFSINVVSALGGAEHRLYTLPCCPGLSWSHDGKILAFSESDEDFSSGRITMLSLADSATRRLSSPPHHGFDRGPVFSPDGSTVAFIRGVGAVGDLYIVPTAGGEPKRLTFDNSYLMGITWTPDGRDIVFSSSRRGFFSLWRISASGGTPRSLEGVGVGAINPSISPKGDQLAYEHTFNKASIWRLDLKDEKSVQGSPGRVTSGRGFGRPNFSPDGKKIAFESDRSGYLEIWSCDSDGSNCAQVTSLRGWVANARWSPDGHYIAFESQLQEYHEISIVEVAGGLPRLIPTFPGADNGAPSWSRDGHWIYFSSNRGGGAFQLWKVPVNGGSPVQVTKNAGFYGVEAEDGRSLYFSKYEGSGMKDEVPGIWKMSLSGGEETRVLDQPEYWPDWVLTRNGIYFIRHDLTLFTSTLEFFEFATHKIVPISILGKWDLELAVSPDGRSILYVQNEFSESESNIMLVKNFH
jgi:Tol biopolymer transport system component/DNA-binding winged helix-turn-helix (wHTH) protein